MDRVITYGFSEDLIDCLSGFILAEFAGKDYDFSRIACVFGGRRPALFLRRSLSKKIKKSFFPPRVFSMDEFMEYTVAGETALKKISDLDSAYLIYNLAKKYASGITSGRESFSEFLPWSREIASFIEQLDLEDINEQSLLSIEKSAEIGYEIPASINILLQHIIKIRKGYHDTLEETEMYSRGRIYLTASCLAGQLPFDEFDHIIFANIFYLHATEQRAIKDIYARGKGICVFQGSPDDWPVLKDNARNFAFTLSPRPGKESSYNLSIYQGFDVHSQACILRHILNNEIKSKDNTVVVVPRPETVIPILSEISFGLDEFNVSLGYPLKRSPLYVLFDSLFKAQKSARDGKYYTKDYLNVLKHPLIKNLNLAGDSAVTRVLVHKLEELFAGVQESSISGTLFLSLDEIEKEDQIYRDTRQTLANMNIDPGADACRGVLEEIHTLLFRQWSKISNFTEFADNLDYLLKILVDKSPVGRFSFNLKVIDKLEEIKQEFGSVFFRDLKFSPDEIWSIFQQRLELAMISFTGSPLKGMQILGLFETRALNFENVVVMDMNESILPKLKIHEPLIPREVMLCLGLNRLEKEEEIQRYQFMRLISGAKNVFLIYEENQEKEKSRFIEELLWQRQKKEKKLEVISIPKISYAIKTGFSPAQIFKTSPMIEFLEKQTYSASRINTYLKCSLLFFYKYVLGLKEKEDLLRDPQSSHIGTFIHDLLEETFIRFKGKPPIIDKKFREYFFEIMENKFKRDIARRMRADAFLLKKIIVNRLEKFLDNEVERDVAELICLEEKRYGEITFNGWPVKFVYTVDRIDRLRDDSVMIIDYKTGGTDVSPKKFKALSAMDLTLESIKENIKSFQLPLYYYFVSKDFPDSTVNAQLYNIRNLQRQSFINDEDLSYKEKIMEICLNALGAVFAELFNPQVPFKPDKADEHKCQFCPFTALCR